MSPYIIGLPLGLSEVTHDVMHAAVAAVYKLIIFSPSNLLEPSSVLADDSFQRELQKKASGEQLLQPVG